MFDPTKLDIDCNNNGKPNPWYRDRSLKYQYLDSK